MNGIASRWVGAASWGWSWSGRPVTPTQHQTLRPGWNKLLLFHHIRPLLFMTAMYIHEHFPLLRMSATPEPSSRSLPPAIRQTYEGRNKGNKHIGKEKEKKGVNTRKDKESLPNPPEPLFLLPQSCEPFLAFPTVPLRGLAAPVSSVTGGPAVLPTSVVARKSRSAWLHRSSANSSAILVRTLPRIGPGSFLVSSKAVVQRVFVGFRCGQFLNRCSRV